MVSLTRFLADKLKLRVNAAKSAVAPPWKRKFLGYSLTRVITELNPILRGWMAYFKLTETKKALEELDGWLRHKLRCICGDSGSVPILVPRT